MQPGIGAVHQRRERLAPLMDSFVVWSHEHQMWWGPNHAGYTPDLNKAGRYTRREAGDIATNCFPPGIEVPVDERMAIRHGNACVWGIKDA